MEDCSFVFIDIIIECRKRQLKELDQEIKGIQNILEPLLEDDNSQEKITKISDSVDRLEEDIKKIKKKKFIRDMEDYKNDRVRNFHKKYNTHYQEEKSIYDQSKDNYQAPKWNWKQGNSRNSNDRRPLQGQYRERNPNLIPLNRNRRTNENWKNPHVNMKEDQIARSKTQSTEYRGMERPDRQSKGNENPRTASKMGGYKSNKMTYPNREKAKEPRQENMGEIRRWEESSKNTREITSWFHPVTPKRKKRKSSNSEEIEEAEEQETNRKRNKKNSQ
ncbi:Hypothetical predicted protein [Pelobates cultripes]|uniref:Uncharacterized protein n=1 Tax=Pelobates cultripes TaxID=61616 RepID=A0AAD1WI00_PELCU|nr:Hypothetical predicted protein [Pelobates cultripes]